jgi:hypothetical protein
MDPFGERVVKAMVVEAAEVEPGKSNRGEVEPGKSNRG